MTSSLATRRAAEAGFTLIETLVALALTGLVLSALANITSQWLPNWNRGIDRIQRSESISLAFQRLSMDIGAAEYVPAGREQRKPLFDGSELSMTFVRTALGPNAKPGLDVVRIGETTDRSGLVTVRSRAPFGPLSSEASISEQIHTTDPVVLLREPYRLGFSYAGPDRVWKSNWHDADRLPAAVMLTVRDAATELVLPVSTVVSIHAEAPAAGQCAQSDNGCDGKSDQGKDEGSKDGAKDNAKDNSGSANAAATQGGSQ
jgi:general secretion pathway protein J